MTTTNNNNNVFENEEEMNIFASLMASPFIMSPPPNEKSPLLETITGSPINPTAVFSHGTPWPKKQTNNHVKKDDGGKENIMLQTSLDTPKSKRRKLAQTLPNEGKKTVSSVKIGGAFASESPFHQRKKLCVNRDHDSNRNHFNSPPPLLPSNNKPSSSSSLKRKRNSSPSTRTRDRLIDSPLPSSLSKHQGKTSPSLKKKTILALQHRLNQAEQKQWTMGVFITTQRTKIQQQEATIELQSATIQEQSEQLHALVDKPPRENNTAPTSRTQTTTKKKTMKTPAKKKMTPAKKTTADSTTQPKKEKKKRQPAVVNSRAAALESAAPTPRTPATKKKTMKTPAKKKTTPAKKTTTDTTQPGTPSHSMVRRSMPPSRAKL